MRDLSKKLWSDLESDEERIRFIESGRAHETGIIAPAIADDMVSALKCRIAIQRYVDWAKDAKQSGGVER